MFDNRLIDRHGILGFDPFEPRAISLLGLLAAQLLNDHLVDLGGLLFHRGGRKGAFVRMLAVIVGNIRFGYLDHRAKFLLDQALDREACPQGFFPVRKIDGGFQQHLLKEAFRIILADLLHSCVQVFFADGHPPVTGVGHEHHFVGQLMDEADDGGPPSRRRLIGLGPVGRPENTKGAMEFILLNIPSADRHENGAIIDSRLPLAAPTGNQRQCNDDGHQTVLHASPKTWRAALGVQQHERSLLLRILNR